MRGRVALPRRRRLRRGRASNGLGGAKPRDFPRRLALLAWRESLGFLVAESAGGACGHQEIFVGQAASEAVGFRLA